MRTVAYLRVSSKAQSWDLQRDAIRREAQERGHEVASWYTEKISGKTLNRSELAALRDDAQQGRIRRVYVFKLDRLTRSGVGDTFKVVDELRRAGVELVAVADNMTIKPGEGDVASDVMIFALGLAAKIERVAIDDRISAARTRIEEEGGRWGRPRRVQGATVSTLLAMKLAGKTVRQIAIATKVPRSSVARVLKEWASSGARGRFEALSQKPPPKPVPKRPRDLGSQGGADR